MCAKVFHIVYLVNKKISDGGIQNFWYKIQYICNPYLLTLLFEVYNNISTNSHAPKEQTFEKFSFEMKS